MCSVHDHAVVEEVSRRLPTAATRVSRSVQVIYEILCT
jgi:hypothetical protein